MTLKRYAALFFLLSSALFAQAPRMTKIDPPNWWVNMPKAMLLVQGENLSGARFRTDNSAVFIDHTKISANGHWAEIWLGLAPVKPLNITVIAETGAGRATMPFNFAPRRGESDGFAGFSSRDVMYLVMTDRYADGDLTNDGPDARSPAGSAIAVEERARPRGWHGGDLRGIIEHLDELQTMGITTIWITPVYQNHEPDSYHGYGATDMYAVDEHYGTLEDYRALAAALHHRGMKLVLDTVPNHVGPAHPWVDDSPEPDWFHGTKANHHIAQGDFVPLVNPYAPWRDRRDVTEGWFADVLPDMNQENPVVSQYLIQNAIWWIEQGGVDGLRIDTFPYVRREFWRDFHATLHRLYPHLTSVGEVFNPDPTVTSSFAGGVTRDGVDTGLYTPFDFPLHVAIRNVFSGKATMDQLADVLRHDSLYPHPEHLIPFLDNHDTSRFLNLPGASVSRQKLALAFLLTTRGMPQLYSGDEIAMTGGDDPENRHDFPGGFPDSKQRSKAARPNPAAQEMATWVSKLLNLRKQESALQTGEEQVVYTSADSIVYLRTEGTRRLIIAIHRGDEEVRFRIQKGNTALQEVRTAERLLGEGSFSSEASDATISLPANSVYIGVLR